MIAYDIDLGMRGRYLVASLRSQTNGIEWNDDNARCRGLFSTDSVKSQ